MQIIKKKSIQYTSKINFLYDDSEKLLEYLPDAFCAFKNSTGGQICECCASVGCAETNSNIRVLVPAITG